MTKTHEVLCPECRAIMVKSLPIPQPDGSTRYVYSLNAGHILYVNS